MGERLRWVTETPTVAGEYWLQTDDDKPRVRRVALMTGGAWMAFDGYGWRDLAFVADRWAGPIPEPEQATTEPPYEHPADGGPSPGLG
jgi:hypothetical protein